MTRVDPCRLPLNGPLTLGAYQGPFMWWKKFWGVVIKHTFYNHPVLRVFSVLESSSGLTKQNNKQFWERSASPRLIKILTVDWFVIIGRGRALVADLEKNGENNSSEEPQVFHSEGSVTEIKIKWNEIRLAKLVVPKSCMLNFIWFDFPTLFLEEKE